MKLSIPISKTKIIPPRRRPELLTRKRLLDALFDSLDKRLTLVLAPAGYGKTSLLIDLVDQNEYPACWLALDELDTEPRRFAAYFIAAIAEKFHQFGSQSKSMLENMSSFDEGMDDLVVTICNEILETIPEHFVFILDDFHLMGEVQPIHDFLERFIRLMGENSHIIISSRELPSFQDMYLLTAQNEVGGLDFSSLAFLPDELQALFAQNKNLQISDEKAKELVDQTEGWITGLQFSDADVLPKSPLGLGNNTTLYRYFDTQVLGKQPPQVREFILRTAMFDEFNASLCETVLADFYPEKQDWQNLVYTISNNNMFVLPVGSDGSSLRYHHLFRDFIRDYFKRERPDEVTPILRKLEAVYEKNGEWEKARQICTQLGDIELLAKMIERATPHIFRNLLLIVESWLNDIPPSVLRERAGLLSIQGLIMEAKGHLDEAIQLLSQAEAIQRKGNDVKSLCLTLSRRAICYQKMGNFFNAIEDADEVIRLAESDDEMQPLHAYGLRVKGLTLHSMGKAQDSIPFFEKSLEIYTRSQENESIATLQLETGMAYRAVGNYSEAQPIYRKALANFKREGSLNSQANLLNNIGVLHHIKGEYDQAVKAFEEGLLCAQDNGLHRPQILISLSFGDLLAELEDFPLAEQRYRQAQDALQKTDERFLSISLKFSWINLALLQEDAKAAHDMLGEAAELVEAGESNYEKGVLHLQLGQLYLLNGQYKKALSELNTAGDIYMKNALETEVSAHYHAWYAAALIQNKEYAQAADAIQGACDAHKNNLHPIVVACHQARKWLDGIPKSAIRTKDVRDVLQKAGRFTNRLIETRRRARLGLKSVQPPAPRLIIRGFGPASVDFGGRQLQTKDWQTQAVRDLFFYFLHLSKPVTKEQAGNEMWDDISEPSKINLRFKNDVYRLRKAVGSETIVNDDNTLYSFNRKIDYEYDVEIFKSLIAKAKSTENETEQIEYYQKAVDKVEGPYLNDILKDWVVQDRTQLDLMYLEALETLAKLYIAHAKPDNALQVSRQAISYEEGHEPAYQIAMQAYHRKGEKTNIKQTYEACRNAMKQKYGMPPSPETETLYKKLME